MIKEDKIKDFHGFTIQYGHFNDRVYLIKGPNIIPEKFPSKLISFAKCKGYGKIFVKVDTTQKDLFLPNGFRAEAEIPGFYKGKNSACFLGYYLDKKREKDSHKNDYDKILKVAQEKECQSAELEEDFELVQCTEKDIHQITEIYSKIFPTYPFPIQKPEYIKETMNSHVDYYAVKKRDRILALSSAEKDMKSLNVEMTDFATLPDYRGHSFAKVLLTKMEKQCQNKGITTSFSIARAASPGMNITFNSMGYKYRGRLINNTNISGRLESMNVWSKSLN